MFRYIDIASVDNKAKRIVNASPTVGRDAPSRARQIVKEGDVLVSMTRPNLNAVAMVPSELTGEICSTGFSVLRCKSLVLPAYIFHYVTTPQFVAKTSAAVSGALYPAITASFLKSLPIPLPPLDEQRRIVSLLDRAADIRRRAEAARAKARAIIPALFLDMFGDPATNPKGWAVVSVGDVLRQASYGTSQKADSNGAGVPVIRMGNVTTDGRLNTDDLKYAELPDAERERVELLPGDLIFNRTNSKELVGKTGLWDGRFNAVAASYFIRMRVDPEWVDPMYIWAFFNTSYMKRTLLAAARGAIGQANINGKELRAFRLGLPPLPLQTAFAEQARRIEATARAFDAAAAKAEAMAAALSHEVFG